MKRLEKYQSIFERLEMTESSFSELFRALPEIAKVFKENDIDFVVIGGLSLHLYGYERMTMDIDLLIAVQDKDKLKPLIGKYLRPRFTNAEKSFYWNEPKAPVDVIFSGDVAGGSGGITYKNPDRISEIVDGVPYLKLDDLIEIKISSYLFGGRSKDLGDVEELIIENKLRYGLLQDRRKDISDTYDEAWNRLKKFGRI